VELKKTLYIETFGCQMNFSDSEIVASVMTDNHYILTQNVNEADVIFLNTCSIRENAEDRVIKRIRQLKHLKRRKEGMIIGILGCMAERLKESLFSYEPAVDLLVGPDSYRDLPRILADVQHTGHQTASILLSSVETYDDIQPLRMESNGVSAFISIMRGCENFCSYCVVPYTRGKERSRDPLSILEECSNLIEKNFKEVSLLGQNVNSYRFTRERKTYTFAGLLREIAGLSPQLRIRFATSHPKDISDELIETIAAFPNICRAIHLPVQSGSDAVLKRMNRKYTREWYLGRIEKILSLIPDCAISTDIICGFPGETADDHQETMRLMKSVAFDYAFMFKYSQREGTSAAKIYPDDVPEEVKSARLQEIISLQQELSHASNRKDIGKTFEVLVEGKSKKSSGEMMGRNSRNKVIVFKSDKSLPGDYVYVKVKSCTSATLLGDLVDKESFREA